MTAPNWRSAGTFASGIGAVTPGLPTGWQQNDIFLLVVKTAEGDIISTPSGWTQLSSSPQATSASSTGSRLAVFWRRATASESAPNIADSGDHTAAIIHAFSGCVLTGDPVNATAGAWNSSSGTTQFPPAITTTVNDVMMVWVYGHGILQSTPMYTPLGTHSGSTEVTERSDDSTASGVGGGFGVSTAKRAAAGSAGAYQVELATSSLRTQISLALMPAALRVFPTTATATVSASQPGAAIGPSAGTALIFANAYDVIPPGAPMDVGLASASVAANSATNAVKALAEHVAVLAISNQAAVQTSGNLVTFPEDNEAVVVTNQPTPSLRISAETIA